MIKNLVNTWNILAPSEIRVDNRGILPIKDDGGCGLLHLDCLRPYQEDMLQGYLQRCVAERRWNFDLSFVGSELNRELGWVVRMAALGVDGHFRGNYANSRDGSTF